MIFWVLKYYYWQTFWNVSELFRISFYMDNLRNNILGSFEFVLIKFVFALNKNIKQTLVHTNRWMTLYFDF